MTSSLLYRILVPKPIRRALLLSLLRKGIPSYYAANPSLMLSQEWKEVVAFVKERGIRIFPYAFVDRYDASSIPVFFDEESGFRYVLHEGKRLYFKKKWSAQRIRKAYNDLSMEQDLESPHRYLSSTFDVSAEDTVVDFGSAEGNFSLSVIERVKKIYLFECDPQWVEALKLTFAPWKDKVEIVQKFVSDKDDNRHCKGDTFFNDKRISFLKIDVDGGERKLLSGFSSILHNRPGLKVALCTYHQQADEAEFTDMLTEMGYTVSPSRGFMIFHYDKKIGPPYLRRALIRAYKI